MAISEATPALNSELTATGSEYRYGVPKICDRAESAKAEAEVRLKFDGVRPLPAEPEENAEIGRRPDIDLAAALGGG